MWCLGHSTAGLGSWMLEAEVAWGGRGVDAEDGGLQSVYKESTQGAELDGQPKSQTPMPWLLITIEYLANVCVRVLMVMSSWSSRC